MASFFCSLCSELCEFDGSEVLRHHQWTLGWKDFWVCPDCADVALCSGSEFGIHGEIFDATEPEFRPELWPGTWLGAEIPTQFGQCSRCWKPMRWDPDDSRWGDLVLAGGYKTLFWGLTAIRNSLRDH